LSYTRIKFCGLTRSEDVDAAVGLGVDAVGFVLVPGSRREVDADQASMLRARVAPTVKVVLLFCDADADRVRACVQRLHPDLLQFHGSETAGFCEQFGVPYLFAIPMGDQDADVAVEVQRHPGATAVLLDSHAKGGMGGQGVPFDWSAIPATSIRPLVLAGGLNAGNVAEAVRQVRPYAVDVSTGIESSPGVKDYAKMQAFIEEVRRVDCG
jgi:phosphoribosylanthranilate isomerase